MCETRADETSRESFEMSTRKRERERERERERASERERERERAREGGQTCIFAREKHEIIAGYVAREGVALNGHQIAERLRRC